MTPVTYVNGGGQVTNLANDGSSADIIVAAPHLASQEWAGVSASTVVIYELDTPVVANGVASETLRFLASLSLGSLFSATDPASKTITEWQVYDAAASDSLVVGGEAAREPCSLPIRVVELANSKVEGRWRGQCQPQGRTSHKVAGSAASRKRSKQSAGFHAGPWLLPYAVAA